MASSIQGQARMQGSPGLEQQAVEFSQTGFVNVSVPVSPKRLVICCDGTWQSSVSGLKNIPSNVTRLARYIERAGRERGEDGTMDPLGKVWQQVAYYDAGIGTGDLNWDEKTRQGGFGVGFIGNIIEAYNFLVMNYTLGDEIFCFGFSRGAYTARAVAGLVNDIGIISPRDMQDFPDLYALYQKHEDSFHFRKSRAYREWVTGVLSAKQPTNVPGGEYRPEYAQPPHSPAAEASRVVHVVGVFDTVGSLGIPDLTWTRGNLKWLEGVWGITKPGFHNVNLSPYIKHAFHALALDEHRGPFSPTLWHLPTEAERAVRKPKKPLEKLKLEWEAVLNKPMASEEEKTAAWSAKVDGEMFEHLKDTDSELSQVWFPGVHINVGGGNDDLLNDRKEDAEQIALISLAWMCERVAPYLQLSADDNLGTLAGIAIEDRINLLAPILEQMKNGAKDYGNHWVWNHAWRWLDDVGVWRSPLISVKDKVVNGWATGPIADSYTGAMAAAGSIPRTPGRYVVAGGTTELGPTNEMVHPSVKYRMLKDTAYKPPALEGFDRSPNAGNTGYEWKKGDVTIPEYLVKPEDHFSRALAMQDYSGEEYLKQGEEGQASDFLGRIDRFVGQRTAERETAEIGES